MSKASSPTTIQMPTSVKGPPSIRNQVSKDSASKCKRSSHGLRMKKETDADLVISPVKPGKRQHRAILSPVTTRLESLSPKAKYRYVDKSSPIPKLFISECTLDLKATNSSDEEVSSNEGLLAVPKLSAEPPCPSQLPNPPLHWVGGSDVQGHAKKPQCRMATQSLMTHLSSSGIIVAAQ